MISGAGLATIMSFLSIPILSRIYNPEEINFQANLLVILETYFSVACFCFDKNIPTITDHEELQVTHTLSTFMIFLSSLCFFVIILCLKDFMSEKLNVELNNFHILVFTFLFLLTGFNRLFFLYSIRLKKFDHLAKTRSIEIFMRSLIQFSLGALSFKTWGLIFAEISGRISIPIYLLQPSQFFKINYTKNFHKIFQLFIRDWKGAMYETFNNIFININRQAPVFIITIFYNPILGGYFAIANKILNLPIRIISIPSSLVFWESFAATVKNNPLQAKSVFLINLRNISFLVFIPFAILCIASIYLVPIILGKNWNQTTSIILMMTPAFAMYSINIAIANAYHLLNLQKLTSLLSIIEFCLFIFSGYLFLQEFPNESFFFISISSISTCFVIIKIISLYIKLSKGKFKTHVKKT